MEIYKKIFVLGVMSISACIQSVPQVPVIKLTNTTIVPIDVQVILGADAYVYNQATVMPLSSTIVKVPGIPGTFTVQYTRSGLMANNVIQVPVVEGTQIIFDESSYAIAQPK
jgi:hypothetical protein